MNIWSVLWIFALIVLSPFAQAAGFNCAKAQTKVERTICDDLEISRLDEELARRYKTALQDQTSADEIKREQKQWLKERNACNEADCLVKIYRKRIGELSVSKTRAKSLLRISSKGPSEEHYVLVMSKNDDVCNHMLQLMNDDLRRFGRTFDRHDAFVKSLREFNSIPWTTVQVSYESSGKTNYQDVEGATFDLNNDGVLDFVIHFKGALSGIRVDSIYMLGEQAKNDPSAIATKDLFNSNDQIDLAVSSYTLSDSLPWDSDRMDMIFPFAYRDVSLRLLSPFIYRGVSYVYMQSQYEKSDAIGGDYAVIAKYFGGVISREGKTGKMEDVCYIKRIDEQ